MPLFDVETNNLTPFLTSTGVVLAIIYYYITLSIQSKKPPKFDAPVLDHSESFLAALKEGKAHVRSSFCELLSLTRLTDIFLVWP